MSCFIFYKIVTSSKKNR